VDEPCGGTLRFSGHWILTNVFVTQADILTSDSSTLAYANASPYVGTLPYQKEVLLFVSKVPLGTDYIQSSSKFTASADDLVPFIFGARALDQ
jgi:hypothetical protein